MRLSGNLVFLLIGVLIYSGCTTATPPAVTVSPSPQQNTISQSTSTPNLVNQSAITDAIAAWKSPEEVWAKLHPRCLEFLDEEGKRNALTMLAGDLVAGQGKTWKIEPCAVSPTVRYTYPVEPTHMITPDSESYPRLLVKVDGATWNLIVSKPTEAALKARAEIKLPEAEKLALAKKIVAELTPEQRDVLVQALQSKGKIAAIKSLRSMNVHSLKVHKLAVEALQEEL